MIVIKQIIYSNTMKCRISFMKYRVVIYNEEENH